MNANADSSGLGRVVKAAQSFISILETFMVTACLGAMVVIVLCQIFMRNVFDSGFVVGDPLVKHIVLWVTFIGASIAAKQGNHIRIDVADRLLHGRARLVKDAIVGLFSAGICTILGYASYRFVAMEFESKTSFGMTEIPVWYLEVIMPIGFGFIALRFALAGISSIIDSLRSA